MNANVTQVTSEPRGTPACLQDMAKLELELQCKLLRHAQAQRELERDLAAHVDAVRRAAPAAPLPGHICFQRMEDAIPPACASLGFRRWRALAVGGEEGAGAA